MALRPINEASDPAAQSGHRAPEPECHEQLAAPPPSMSPIPPSNQHEMSTEGEANVKMGAVDHAKPGPASPLANGADAAAAPPPVEVNPVDDDDVDGDDGAPLDDGVADSESEPMGAQMDQLRFHLRSGMAALFAPVHRGAVAVGASATPMSMPLSTLIQELDGSQLMELNSYLTSMSCAVRQQMKKQGLGQSRVGGPGPGFGNMSMTGQRGSARSGAVTPPAAQHASAIRRQRSVSPHTRR